MRQALLTCDRCGTQEAVPIGGAAEGWRLLVGDASTVAGDLCPSCNELVLAMLKPANGNTPE